MDDAMLEAHVAYEMSRLSQDDAEGTVHVEVAAAFSWLGTVRLDDVLDRDTVRDTVVRVAREIPAETMHAQVVDAVPAVLDAIDGSPDTVGDLITTTDATRWAESLASMEDARDELLTRLTTSTAYSRVVAHVVYHGVKSYILTENALAKRIPGASSLVRLGQKGLGAAAPGLEQNVDKQLIAFVDSSIADTIRESRRFIDRMLDEGDPATTAATAHAAVADHPVSAVVDVVTQDEAATLASLVWQQWVSSRGSETVARVAAGVVDHYFDVNADRPVREVLADLGVTEAWVIDRLTPLVQTSLAGEAVRAYAESRIRARLSAFYAEYDG